MGCWNHTCALTNLPVSVGEPVYVIVLHKQQAHNLCHATSYWKPIELMFEGTYDDYGGVEDCTGLMLPHLIEAIKDKLVELEVGDNKYHDIPVKRSEFNVAKLFEADHESRLFVESSGWERQQGVARVPLKHIVIRKAVLDSLLAKYTFEVGYSNTPPVKFANVVADGQALFAELQNQSVNDPLANALELLNARDGTHHDRLFGGPIHHAMDLPSIVRPYNLALSFLKQGLEPELQELIKQMVVFYWLNVFMNDCRRVWVPPSGAGSQNSNTVAQRLLASITKTEATRYDRRWDE